MKRLEVLAAIALMVPTMTQAANTAKGDVSAPKPFPKWRLQAHANRLRPKVQNAIRLAERLRENSEHIVGGLAPKEPSDFASASTGHRRLEFREIPRRISAHLGTVIERSHGLLSTVDSVLRVATKPVPNEKAAERAKRNREYAGQMVSFERKLTRRVNRLAQLSALLLDADQQLSQQDRKDLATGIMAGSEQLEMLFLGGGEVRPTHEPGSLVVEHGRRASKQIAGIAEAPLLAEIVDAPDGAVTEQERALATAIRTGSSQANVSVADAMRNLKADSGGIFGFPLADKALAMEEAWRKARGIAFGTLGAYRKLRTDPARRSMEPDRRYLSYLRQNGLRVRAAIKAANEATNAFTAAVLAVSEE